MSAVTSYSKHLPPKLSEVVSKNGEALRKLDPITFQDCISYVTMTFKAPQATFNFKFQDKTAVTCEMMATKSVDQSNDDSKCEVVQCKDKAKIDAIIESVVTVIESFSNLIVD